MFDLITQVTQTPLHEITTDEKIEKMYTKGKFPFEMLGNYILKHPGIPTCNEPVVEWKGKDKANRDVVRYGQVDPSSGA